MGERRVVIENTGVKSNITVNVSLYPKRGGGSTGINF